MQWKSCFHGLPYCGWNIMPRELLGREKFQSRMLQIYSVLTQSSVVFIKKVSQFVVWIWSAIEMVLPSFFFFWGEDLLTVTLHFFILSFRCLVLISCYSWWIFWLFIFFLFPLCSFKSCYSDIGMLEKVNVLIFFSYCPSILFCFLENSLNSFSNNQHDISLSKQPWKLEDNLVVLSIQRK